MTFSNALQHAKERFVLDPDIVTVDLAPSAIAAVCQVFGRNKLQIDGFHVMQELARGVRRDILDYKKQHFTAEIRDLHRLRTWVNNTRQRLNTELTLSSDVLTEAFVKDYQSMKNKKCFRLVKSWLPVFPASSVEIFSQLFNKRLRTTRRTSQVEKDLLLTPLKTHLPQGPITEKGRQRLQGEVFKKFKNIFLYYRRKIEEVGTEFNKHYWLLFYQPEHLTPERQHRLTTFLHKYPELTEYRQLLLTVGALYRQPLDQCSESQLDQLPVQPYFSSNLRTALETIKKYKDAILRFCTAFKNNPVLTRSCRANMEHYNRNFKAPFKKGLNRAKVTTLINKLQLQLGCEVRWLLPQPIAV